jgi:hypothetical protein
MKYFAVRFSLFLLLVTFAVSGSQSLISGDLAGTVYDSSGAVVPGASLV